MDALENMIKAIVDDAEQEINAYLAMEKATLDEKQVRKMNELDKEEKQQKEQVKNKLDKSFRQLTARERLNFRERIMNDKMMYLNQVFDEALTILNSWSKEEVQNFFISIVERFPEGKYRVLIGEKSEDYLTDAYMNSLKDGKQYSMGNIVAKKGGFILEREDQIQYDYLFDNVISVLKERYLFKVSEILFK